MADSEVDSLLAQHLGRGYLEVVGTDHNGDTLYRATTKGVGFAERLLSVVAGIRRFIAEMREQELHVGVAIGADEAWCVTCDESWPCAATRSPGESGR